MKTKLTKTDGLYILKYYNIQIPNNEQNLIKTADNYIEQNLCRCITNHPIKKHNYNHNQNQKIKCILRSPAKSRTKKYKQM